MLDREPYRPTHGNPPPDAYGPGYVIHNLRSDFADLCRQIGFAAARAEVAEIINDEAEGRRK